MLTTIHAHTKHVIGEVDPRIFGGFLEHMGRAVYEGVFEPSSPHADENGFRADVIEALARLGFTAMRYPGGNFVSGYHWTDGVGPREQRPRVRELAWQSIETNQFGTDEFMQLSRKLNWTPMMSVNLGTGTPEEARDLVEYCNIASGSKWADRRVANGHAEPHNVPLWCLGNEMDGPWQIGAVPVEHYAIKAQQAARMMKSIDPSIEVVACGSSGPGMSTFLEWDRSVLKHCGDAVDYISLHCYLGNEKHDTPSFLACGLAIDAQIEAVDALCRYLQTSLHLKKRVFLSFDEWNVWYRTRDGEHVNGRGKVAPHLLEEIYTLEDALVVASCLNSFIRHADSVKIANLAQIVNVIAPILTRGDAMVLQTIFYPFEMFSRRRNGTSLRLSVDGPTYSTTQFGDVRYIDCSAVLDGSRIKLFAVNRSIDSAMDVEFRVADASITSVIDGEIVTGNDPSTTNTFDAPTRIISQPFQDVRCTNGIAVLHLPPLSFVAITFATEMSTTQAAS